MTESRAILRKSSRRCLSVFGFLGAIFTKAKLACAQSSVPGAVEEKSYGLPYLVVILLVSAGLILVLRTSFRHKVERRKKE